LEVVWRNLTHGGQVQIAAIEPGIKLAEEHRENDQLNAAIEI
jgi:hypothetical protein